MQTSLLLVWLYESIGRAIIVTLVSVSELISIAATFVKVFCVMEIDKALSGELSCTT